MIQEVSLVETLKAVEAVGSLVPGHDEGDLRDAIVIVSGKVSKLKRLQNWKNPPCWTMKEMWAADLVLRSFGVVLVGKDGGAGDGIGDG